jgi:hypothetical protein
MSEKYLSFQQNGRLFSNYVKRLGHRTARRYSSFEVLLRAFRDSPIRVTKYLGRGGRSDRDQHPIQAQSADAGVDK